MNRIAQGTRAFAAKGVDGVLISEIKNVRYLTGFSGSSACLLLSGRKKWFITDFRYQELAKKEIRGFELVIEKGERPKLIADLATSCGVKVLGFESTVSYGFYRELLAKKLKLRALTNLVEDMRKIKDREELRSIREAVSRAETAFRKVKPFIKTGRSEKQIALQLEENLRNEGCGQMPFDIIVASGPHSSMPHAQPTENKIRGGDFVVIDWGGESGGYFSDMTRTFLMKGRDLVKKKKMYETVLRANRTAIDSVREGVHARTVDRAARDVIRNAGYDEFFGHGTGHGVGLDVHEFPRISRLGRDCLKSGMVFTIEPGIYVPGLGGVRIEDMVVAGKNGCKVLTDIPKTLEILS